MIPFDFVVIAIVLAALGYLAFDMGRERRNRREIPADYRRIAVLEHELGIAGHEVGCEWCEERALQLDSLRELSLARLQAWEAMSMANRTDVEQGLAAARERAAQRAAAQPAKRQRWHDPYGPPDLSPEFDWVEVTTFGEAEPHYIKGRRK